MLWYILLFAVIGFAFSLLVTPWVIKLAWATGVVRYPPSYYLKKMKQKGMALDQFKLMAIKRRLEKPPTPEWGGISYVLGFFLIAAVGLILSKQINLGAEFLSDYFLWALSIIVLFVVNVIDDKYELPSWVLLTTYIVASLIFVASTFSLVEVSMPFGDKLNLGGSVITAWLGGFKIHLNLWTDLLIIPYLLFMILALKVQAGADAVMEFNTFVALVWVAIISYTSGHLTPAFLAAVLAGLLAGFLFFNWYPAKIWSGEAGDGTIGFIIATFSIIGRSNLSAILILFALPIVDWVFVLYKRLKRVLKTHKKVWLILKMSDKNHLHHRLLKIGLTEPHVALLEGFITFILGFLVYVTPVEYRNELLVIVYIVTWIGMVITDYLAKKVTIQKHSKNK